MYMKIIFWGSGLYGNISLQRLIERGLLPNLVITKPDAPKGRGQIISPNEVAQTAENSKIKILKPEKLDEEFIKIIKQEKPDIFLVVSYGKILPKKILEIPSFGTINIHPSLLPKYRGTSPLETTFLNNDSITGVTLIMLDEEMDHGPILIQDKFKIHPEMQKIDLGKILFEHGTDLFIDNLKLILDKDIIPKEQNHTEATYTKKIKKEDGLVDIRHDLPKSMWNKYRAYFGWPGIYFFDSNKKRIKITKAHFDETQNTFVIEKVIPEGKKEIDYNSMFN